VRSSTSFDFPAIDTRGNGSWVVGTAGGSALVPCTPTLMSQATSVGTGPAGAVKDTNQSIVGWRDTICTVATSGNLEIDYRDREHGFRTTSTIIDWCRSVI